MLANAPGESGAGAREDERAAARYSPQLCHWPAERPQTPTVRPGPRFFYTNTCPSCLDPVATGNQTAESELRKPHPASRSPASGRLLNSHSQLGAFQNQAANKGERAAGRRGGGGPGLGPALAPLGRPSDTPPHLQGTSGRHSWAKTVAGARCATVQRFTETREWFLLALFPQNEIRTFPYISWVRNEKQRHE